MNLFEAIVILLATAMTLFSLLRELPLQNVLSVTAILFTISALIDRLAAHLLPGDEMFWLVPLAGFVGILSSRSAARVALSHWQTSEVYGLWLIGLTGVLSGVFGFGIQHFDALALPNSTLATKNSTWWITSASGLKAILWALTALLAIPCATPWLINKIPIKQPAAAPAPVTWLLLNALFLVAACRLRFWGEAVIISASNAVLFVLAGRGALDNWRLALCNRVD